MIENETLDNLDFNVEKYAEEYENCVFKNCSFSESDVSSIKFMECRFENCDWSSAKLTDTCFREVAFKNCKMLGLRFEDCNPLLLEFSFDDCVLDFSTFYGLTIRQTPFVNCSLKEVDFGTADLTGSVFRNSLLERVVFDRTNLEKVDFREAIRFEIDPSINKLKGALFGRENLSGLVSHLGIKIR